MSFEAVPCRFRSKTGPNGETEYVGILIRPAGETGPIQSPGPVGTPNGVRAVSTPHPPFRVIPSGVPVSGDNVPKMLVPTNIGVRLAPSAAETPPLNGNWQPTPRVVNTAFSSPPQSISSPILQQPRSLSVCSSSPMTASSPMSPPPQQYPQQNCRQRDTNPPRNWQPADSSTTPDSGIQSVPGSPPSHHRESPPTIEACSSVCEDRPEEEEEDFADMPRLIPIDQEEEFYSPGPSTNREEHSTNGSECETTAPQALSITPLMDNARAAEQLIQLDPAKAYDIAKEIHKQMGLAAPDKGRKRKLPKKEPASKKNRPGSSASDDYKKSEEEVKEQTPPLKLTSSPETAEVPSTSAFSNTGDSRKLYRQAVKRMMEKQLADAIERAAVGVQNLHIGERERHERRKTKAKSGLFSIDWDSLRKRRRHHEDRILQWKKNAWAAYKVKNEPKEEVDAEPVKTKPFGRKRKINDTVVKEEPLPSPPRPRQGSLRTPSKRRNTLDSTGSESFERRPDMDYDEIPRTVCEKDLPGWRVPTVRCGCTRGACNSDAECINRALFVQCQSNCQAHMCINKKFWKEDAVRLLTAPGPKSKKVLKTKSARRAGDFLGEFAGEVVPFAEAERRWKEYQESDLPPRILSLSPSLFVDATKMGNVSRFVRHSCRPNSRLEVWSINGTLRAGLFPLFDLASGTEVTISMTGILPIDVPCTSCSANEKCCKLIKRSSNAFLSSAEALSPEEEKIVVEEHAFLRRNRRKAIQHASRNYVHRNSSVPSTTKGCLQKILDGFQLRIRRVDGSLPFKSIRPYSALCRAVASGDTSYFHSAVENLLEKLDDDDLDRVNSALNSQYLGIGDGKDKKHHHLRNREVDLSYLDSLPPVATYNPDSAWPKGPASKKDDAVRCDCGSLEEDGTMHQCDECNFWLHAECIGNIDEKVKFQCRLCSGEIPDGIPSTDVELVGQPDVRLEGCSYFKALVNNRKIQVRQYETVYVEKMETDDHKKVLKKLTEINEKGKKKKGGEEKSKSAQMTPSAPLKLNLPGLRKETRIFRVERLFVAPGGYRFVFGFYYARPHETICDPQRMFHKNEVFATPFYDTLPLDSVVGRCIVLDPEIFIKGRPTVPKFKEEDVLVCDYQIDKQQRSFEKIPVRNRFPMNTQPYVFAKFDSPRPLVRDFTPFLIGDRSSSRSAGRLSRNESSKTDAQTKHQSAVRLEAVISRLSSADGAVKGGRKRKRSLLP